MKKNLISLLFSVVLCFSLSTSVFAAPPEQLTTETFESTIMDDLVYWIKGYVTVDYYPSTGHITQTTARSALLGLTVGKKWEPNDPRITVLSDVKRKVMFTGVLSTPLISKDVEHTTLVQTKLLFEAPCKTCPRD